MFSSSKDVGAICFLLLLKMLIFCLWLLTRDCIYGNYLDTWMSRNFPPLCNFQGTARSLQKLAHCKLGPWLWTPGHKRLCIGTSGPNLAIRHLWLQHHCHHRKRSIRQSYLDTRITCNVQPLLKFRDIDHRLQKLGDCMHGPWIWIQVRKRLCIGTTGPILAIGQWWLQKKPIPKTDQV